VTKDEVIIIQPLGGGTEDEWRETDEAAKAAGIPLKRMQLSGLTAANTEGVLAHVLPAIRERLVIIERPMLGEAALSRLTLLLRVPVLAVSAD
jgi:hypothetical protein